MATLSDPTDRLGEPDREEMRRMAAARAGADGNPELAQVYVRMFNHPALARAVGALGEAIRFHGVLPGDVRELAILRYSAHHGYRYEWSHHVRPAHAAGLDDAALSAVGALEVPDGLRPDQRAALEAVDAVASGSSIPDDVQATLVAAHGEAGVVELVVLCGLYAVMGYTCTSFDIDVEPGYPTAPF